MSLGSFDCSALFVPVTVLLEFEWVLRSSFAFGKDDVLMTLSSLLSATELTFESERALEVALQLFRKGSSNVADCLHVALATQAGEQPLWTFEKGAARLAEHLPQGQVHQLKVRLPPSDIVLRHGGQKVVFERRSCGVLEWRHG